MARINVTEEIRRITAETAAEASRKALEVADLAKTRAAEVATLAISKALDASTQAAEKAASAAVAAAAVANATSLDLSYIKADIASTKADIKAINDKLDNRYVNKDDFGNLARLVTEHISQNRSDQSALEVRTTALERSNYEVKGKGEGAKNMWGYVAGALGLFIAIASFLIPHLH